MTSSELTAALDKASSSMHLAKGGHAGGMHCSDYLRSVGHALPNSLRDKLGKEWRGNANQIFDAVTAKDSAWQPVSPVKAQVLANAGALAIGVQHGSAHGHVVVVTPVVGGTGNHPKDAAHGPFVRDGNDHVNEKTGSIAASSWGAVQASRVFNPNRPGPVWYVWKPSLHSRGTEGQ